MSGPRQIVFANRMAAFLWGFAAVWLGMLALFTWILVRDGPPEGYSPEIAWAIVGIFWIAGLGLGGYALSRPCHLAEIDGGGTARFTWRYPHRRVRREVPTGALAPPRVVEGTDDEGDPYFHARIVLPGGETFDLAEGHDRERCEAACRRFTEALG